MSIATKPDLLASLDGIRPVIEAGAAAAERDRQLPLSVYDAFASAGLLRMFVPRAVGGDEVHPSEAYRVIEEVARIDSAAGWSLGIGSAFAGAVQFLGQNGVEEIYGGPRGADATIAGGFFPPGMAHPTDGGYRITSRASFASGCHRADWIMVPALVMDGEQPTMWPGTESPVTIAAFVPAAEATIHDTWHTTGMRGTFSADVEVADRFVPNHRTGFIAPVEHPAPAVSGPIFRMTFWTGVWAETAVSLGVAQAAVDELRRLGSVKTPNFGTEQLRDRASAQRNLARAEALVAASREYLHATVRDAYQEAEDSGGLSVEMKCRAQLAACFAAERCAEAVRLVHESAGSTSFRQESPIERHFRDIHVLTQHASKSMPRYDDVGRLRFGLPTDWFLLNL